MLTAAARSRTALKVLVLRPFIPMAVRNFSLYWRNKMVDWLPWAALREMRELSRTLDRCARNVFHEKKEELEVFCHKKTLAITTKIRVENEKARNERECLLTK